MLAFRRLFNIVFKSSNSGQMSIFAYPLKPHVVLICIDAEVIFRIGFCLNSNPITAMFSFRLSKENIKFICAKKL